MATILRTRKFINFFTGYYLKIYQFNYSPLKFALKSNYATLHPNKYHSTAEVVIKFINRSEPTQLETLEIIIEKYQKMNTSVYNDLEKFLQHYDSARREPQSSLPVILLEKNMQMLIYCCGKVMNYEMPSSRSKLLSKLWQIYKSEDLPLALPIYNSLLCVYLENGQDFSPVEILLEMNNKNILPDRFTYEYLLRHYCEKGNIEEAYRILNFLKESEIPINENIFGALIIGNAEANNIKEAKNVLNIMRDMGRRPSSKTYAALLVAYAKKGDLENILETLNFCDSKDIIISDKYKMDIVYSLARNGYENHIDKILSTFSWDYTFNLESLNLMTKLLDIEAVDVAIKVLLAAKKAEISESQLFKALLPLTKNIIQLDLPEEKIIESFNLLEKNGFSVYNKSLLECTLTKITKHYIPLLRAWCKIGFEVQEPIFWPLLANIGSENVKGVLEIVQLMKNEFDIQPSFDTLTRFVLPYIGNCNSPEIINTLILDCKIPADLTVNAILYRELSNHKMKNALMCIKNSAEHTVNYNTKLLFPFLEAALQKTNDITSYYLIKAKIEGKQEIKDQRKKQKHQEFNTITILNNVIIGFKLKEYSEKGDLNNAQNCMSEIKNNYANKLPVDKLLHYVDLLVKNDMRADVKQILKDLENLGIAYFCTNREIRDKCTKSLELMAEKGYVEEINQLYNLLLKKDWKPVMSFTKQLVQVHLVQNDLKAALETVARVQKEHKYIPAQIELMKALIKAEEIDSLQWLTDFSIKYEGENRTLLSLAVAFLKTQRLRQCKRILESAALPLGDSVVRRFVNTFLLEDDIPLVKDLIKVTQGLYSVNRNILYHMLLEKYSLLNNWKEALALLNQMQNEQIIPSETFLVILEELLKRNHQSVPFLLPKFICDLEEQDDFYSKVIKMYLKENAYPYKAYLDHLVQNVVEAGNIKTIELIENNWKRIHGGYLEKELIKFEAYVKSNNVDSFLKQIQKSISSDDAELKKFNFPLNHSLVKYLLSHPESIDLFESLAFKIFSRSSYVKPLLTVLSYYLIKDDPKSKLIWNKIAGKVHKYYNTYSFLVNSFVVTDNFDLLPKLAESLHEYRYMNKRHFYEALLTAYEEKNRYEEGLQVLDKLKLQKEEVNEENNYSTPKRFQLAL